MSIRRTFQIGIVALSLAGAFAPMLSSSDAQVTGGAGDATVVRGTADTTDRHRPDFGWLGVLGLVGLAGLMGNKREDHRLTRTATQTA